MYPGEDYDFDGDYVTEYPMMQEGGWLSKYQDGGGVLSRSNLEMMSALEKDIKNQKTRSAQETISQYTPKLGDQERMNAAKDAYRKEQAKPLNRLANNPHIIAGDKNLPGGIEFALDVMTAGEATAALNTIAKPALKAAGKYLTEKTALKNAYKLNPYAFKPNEANWYRQVGESAIDDAFNTKVIRVPGEEVSPKMLKEFEEQIVRMQGSDELPHQERMMQQAMASRTPASPYFIKGELFYPMGRKPTITKSGKISNNPAGKGSADYLIETGLPNESFQPSYVKSMGLGVPSQVGETAILKPNPTLRDIENFKFYKQDWLKGYKEVPKKENGGWLNKYK
jgi:hypothetical protein